MTVFTIGHFDYDLVTFHEMMEKGKVTKIIDVRAFPMSKKSQQYNQDGSRNGLNKIIINTNTSLYLVVDVVFLALLAMI